MDKITSRNGNVVSMQGKDAVNIFRLATIISDLKFELKTGMKMTRVSTLKVAKEVTGLKTNNKEKQIERLELILEQAKTQVIYVDEDQ